jgi:universal stress protein F
MYKSILVPVDMHEHGFSNKAIEHARGVLAEGGKLHFLHVIPGYQMPWVGTFFPEDAFDKAIKEAKNKLAEYIELQMGGSEIPYAMYTVEGKPAELILRSAEKLQVDLIVMASHKHSRIEKTVLGSIAAKVAGRCKVPVLVIKDN